MITTIACGLIGSAYAAKDIGDESRKLILEMAKPEFTHFDHPRRLPEWDDVSDPEKLKLIENPSTKDCRAFWYEDPDNTWETGVYTVVDNKIFDFQWQEEYARIQKFNQKLESCGPHGMELKISSKDILDKMEPYCHNYEAGEVISFTRGGQNYEATVTHSQFMVRNGVSMLESLYEECEQEQRYGRVVRKHPPRPNKLYILTNRGRVYPQEIETVNTLLKALNVNINEKKINFS